MSELAALIAQLSGSNQQPAQDPALAAVKLARASIDALVLKLGQSIDAKVVGQLSAGLTQLTAGSESFVLKLETPLPIGTAVTIKMAQTPQGLPAVTVSVPSSVPQVAQPMPVPTPAVPLVQAQPASPTHQALPKVAQLPLPEPDAPPAAIPGGPASPRQSATPKTPQAGQQAPPLPQPAPAFATAMAQPSALPTRPASSGATTSVVGAPAPQPPAAPSPQPVAQPLPLSAPPPAVQALSPSLAQPAAQAALPMPPPAIAAALAQPAAPAQPQPAPLPGGVVPTTLPATPAPAVQPAVVAAPQPVAQATAPLPASLTTPPAVQPLPTQPSPYPVRASQASTTAPAQQLPLAGSATIRTPAPTLNLADPAQAAARQDSAAPLLAKLATIVTATMPSLPGPVIELALKLLANRVDLNRAAPDAKTLEAAVMKAGVLLTPPSREPATDSRTGLLALRSTLLAFLGGDNVPPVATGERPAPPIKGEPPRAPTPQAALPDPSADAQDTARTLLGQTDAALSRLKLLQSASQPPDIRADAPAPRNELRVEIPMLLGAETGILQLMVERDARHKREPERQRGWRMRFAMNFSATGEVGADIALLGRTASVAIWAADPDTADALDALLPELAPAIQRHGLELTSLRVRRGAPQHARTAPGQLLDSAR